MSDDRQSIRPSVITEDSAVSDAERFQNEVLRPILKLQHDLLAAVFLHYMAKRKIAFANLPHPKQLEQIAQSLSKDNRLRMTLLGAVIGHFTTEEYQTFRAHESELTRRTMEMMAVRLGDVVK